MFPFLARSTLHRSESWWHQSPWPTEPNSGTSPSRPGRHCLPSPSPLHPHPTDKWLNCSLSDLHLQPQQWESRRRTWIGSAPMHTIACPHSPLRLVAECPPLVLAQKQVWFDLANDLGDALSLPTDLINFLGEDITDDWIDAPHPTAPLTADPTQLPHDNSNQLCSTHTGGTWPKTITAKPKAAAQAGLWPRRGPDLVEHPTNWIQVQMIQNPVPPSWWKELRSIHRESVCKLGVSLVQQLTQWQAASFQLPIAQEEESGWWKAPCSLPGLCLQDFLPCNDSPSTRDFWEKRKEETLGLAWALQHCAGGWGHLPRVLCDAAWNIQRCIASLMDLEADEIVEMSLLGPTDNGSRMSPTLAEEAVLLGDELEPQEAQKATTCPHEHLGAPEPKEPAEQSYAPHPPAPSATTPGSSGNQSQDANRAWHRARPRCLANWDANPMTGSSPIWPKEMSKRDWPEF